MTLELDEADRQLVLLALGLMCLLRPGFAHAAGLVADQMDGRLMMNWFKQLNADTVRPKYANLPLPALYVAPLSEEAERQDPGTQDTMRPQSESE